MMKTVTMRLENANAELRVARLKEFFKKGVDK